MKAQLNVSIDDDLLNEMRKKNINISGTINMLVRDYLKPKKANIADEEKLHKITEFAKQLNNINEEMAIDLYENIDVEVRYEWERFKNKFKPEFNLFEFIEYRKKFREYFLK